MNDDTSPRPATAARGPRPQAGADDAPAVAPPAEEPSNGNEDDSPEARLRRRTVIQTRKKSEFIHDITVNLDMLIYAELSFMYSLDCSFFRLFLRTIIQLAFLSPNKATPPFTGHRPYVVAILGSNAFCIFLHLISALPSASELTRGYLHGGIIIDFIGQRPPSSKLVLLALDIVILCLQVFMLSVHIEEDRLKKALASKDSIAEFIARGGMESAEDHDAEERGIGQHIVQSTDDIELQNFASSSAGPTNEAAGVEERDALLAERMRRADAEEEDGPLDIFYSGNVMVGEFHVLDTIKRQWRRQDNAANALLVAGHTAGYEWTRASQGITRRFDTLR